MQEILVLYILLCKGTDWLGKLNLIFDLFKGAGDEEIYYDDVVLIAQVVAMSLGRLWAAIQCDQPELNTLTEGLADQG